MLEFTEEQAYEMYTKAENYIKDKDEGKALVCYQEARKMYSELYNDLHEGVLSCYLQQAQIYKKSNLLDLAFGLYKLSYLIAKAINYDKIAYIEADINLLKDMMYSILEENGDNEDQWVNKYLKNLQAIMDVKDYYDDANVCYSFISKVYERLNDDDKVLMYLDLAIKNLENYETLNQDAIAYCYQYKGNILTLNSKFNEAINEYKKEREWLAKKYSDQSEEYYVAELDMCRTYIYAMNMGEANKIYDRVFSIMKEKYIDSFYSLSMALDIADALFDVNIFNKALETYKTALEVAKMVFKEKPDQCENLKFLIVNKFKEKNQEELCKEL